jgi:hypothetical protein
MLRRISLFAFLTAFAAGVFAAPVPPGTDKKYPDTDEAVPATDADKPNVRKTSSNNLKQIALAVHNFASANNNKLPRDIFDKDGKPLLSWRVAILAYVEAGELYKQFKLNEPWDSPDNIKLLEKMPKVFDSPRVKARKGYTVYQGFFGNGAVINSRYSIGNIPDGTSTTIWCLEATATVPWSKPTDMPFDPMKDLPKFGKAFGEKPLAALCDGSVRTLDLKKISADTLKNAISCDDGNVLGADW